MSSEGWRTVRLEDIQAPQKYALVGGPFGSRLVSADYTEDGVPVIRGSNLSTDGRFSFNDLVFVSEAKADELIGNNAHPGDLVFTQRGTLGQIGLIPKNCGYKRFVISQSQMKMTVDEAQADAGYLYYYFRSPETVDHINRLAISSGVPHINLAILRDFRVMLPPLPIQRRIVAVLSAYDDLIEVNQQRIEALEAAAQALYREWFVEMRFPGYESAEWVESELGVIPAGWEVCRFGDIAQQVRRNVQPDEVKPETPYVGLAHIPSRSLALHAWGQAQETTSSKLVFYEGEILFAKIRPYLHKVVVAPLDGVCSSDTIVIVPVASTLHGYVTMLSSSKEFVDYADATSKGTSMPRADWDAMAEYQVLLPPDELLIRLNNFVHDVIGHVRTSIFRNRVLRETRDLLLPRLISGEVSVEGLPLPGEGQ